MLLASCAAQTPGQQITVDKVGSAQWLELEMILSGGSTLIRAIRAICCECIDTFCRVPYGAAVGASRRREPQIGMALAHVNPTCREGDVYRAWTNECLWAAKLIRVLLLWPSELPKGQSRLNSPAHLHCMHEQPLVQVAVTVACPSLSVQENLTMRFSRENHFRSSFRSQTTALG